MDFNGARIAAVYEPCTPPKLGVFRLFKPQS